LRNSIFMNTWFKLLMVIYRYLLLFYDSLFSFYMFIILKTCPLSYMFLGAKGHTEQMAEANINNY
jgi:hypothetical protein